MCRTMLFSDRALKQNLFDIDIVVKKNRNVVYGGLYSYRQRVRVINLFPNICSYRFCIQQIHQVWFVNNS